MACILLVEDDPSVRKLVRLTLELEGHEVTVVDRGADAVATAERLDVDLVVLDVMLPGLDGLDVCRALRSNAVTASLGVVMLSARAQASDVDAGFAAGADAYVTKPFEPLDLVSRVDEVLHETSPRERNEPIPLPR